MPRSGGAGHLIDYHPAAAIDRNWTALAVHRLEADARRSADTHLVKLPLAGPVDLYLKDESTHPTGSLKHRLGCGITHRDHTWKEVDAPPPIWVAV
jgi:hypothetical protein